MKLETLSAVALGRLIAKGELSSREVVAYFLTRSRERDSSIGAYINVVDDDTVLHNAEQLDRQLRSSQLPEALSRSQLAGVPIAIKDVLCLEGLPTTCGSRMLETYRSPYTATSVRRLLASGLIPLGKTNMDEFAMGSSTENSAFGVTRNPWDLDRTPGGSSGGAAAVLSAGMAPVSIGSDTGGSVRQPAAFCGVCGLKPTYGLISRLGLIAYASSLDQVGPLAHHVEDLAALLQILAGHDPQDSTSLNVAIPDYGAVLQNSSLKGLRVGVVSEHANHPSLDPEIAAAVGRARAMLESLGATMREVHLPHSRYSVAAYYVIASCEASSNLARYEAAHYGYRAPMAEKRAGTLAGAPAGTTPTGATSEAASGRAASGGARSGGAGDSSPLEQMMVRSRSQGFGEEVQRRIMLGTFALSAGYAEAYYKQALKVRRLIADDYRAAFQQVDLLLGPVVPTPAFVLGEKLNDPVQMYLEDLFTVEANLAGLPAMSIPCGFNQNGLPLAIQLQGPQLEESRLLQTAYQLQKAGLFEPRIADL